MEQSDKIEKQLVPLKVAGKSIYRCPYEDCRKKFDKKRPTVDHIRSIHLQLKSFCENCEKDVSFVAFNRHVRSCLGRKVVSEAAKPNNIRYHITRSATNAQSRLIHEVNSPTSISRQSVDDVNIPKIEQASTQQFHQTQTPNSAINEIALLWSYERSREDELDLFGRFVVSEIRGLTKSDQFYLKKRIQQLLLEYDPPEPSDSVEMATTSNSQIITQSDQGISDEASTQNNSHNAESMDYRIQPIIIPKVEPVDWPVAEESVLTTMKCLFCNRYNSDVFHGNVNEITTSYSHTRILDIIEGWLGSFKPNENCVCCDSCLRKINKYDLERMNLQKVLQSDLLSFDP